MANPNQPQFAQGGPRPQGDQRSGSNAPAPVSSATARVDVPPVARQPQDVTYVPGPSDPASVTWRGQVFYANTPKTISDPAHLDAAAGNRFFKVGVFDRNEASQVQAPDMPKTSEQYRAHVIRWLTRVGTVGELTQRWEVEEPLRIACDVGTDDIEFLMGLIGPKREELRKVEMAAGS